MIKFYCDRCGKDMTEKEHISVTLEYIGNGEPSPKAPDEYDICHECIRKLNEFLEPLQISECEGNDEA